MVGRKRKASATVGRRLRKRSTKRSTKRSIKRSVHRVVRQRNADMISQIKDNEEYNDFIDELQDYELTEAEPINVNVNGTNVRIVPRPEATPMFYGFKIYYRIGRDRPVFIENVSTGGQVRDSSHPVIGA